jgi:large subunit ribosomal protein L19
VKKKGKVRRAKLYYLRDRVGKATRVAEKLGVLAVAAADDKPAEQAVKPRQKTDVAGTEGAKAKN